ncbi:hypothetical protein [uncultured Eubacterium sp.]|uniref:hypothetical protein n=1 Tax=uncultured Eubacterium sp. TaxID=165185 RepID=UPI00260C3AE3|nr:hypothetical protein [uncultured Eubacterium sp.]
MNKSHKSSAGFRKFVCYFLALVMAASVTLFISVGIAASLLRTNTFVQHRYEKYNSQTLKTVYDEFGKVAEQTGIPKKAYSSAITSKHIESVLHIASNNIVKGYKTDYSNSKFLYNYLKNSVSEYCENNDISVTDEQLNRFVCNAVDAFNNALGDESTNNIIIIALTYTNRPMIAMLISAIVFVLCVVAIDFISRRRHKKYEYIGVSFITAGEVLTVLPFFAIIMKYANELHFTDVTVYNLALADTLNDILKIIMAVGVLVLIAGVLIVVRNYKYYKHKTKDINTEREIVEGIKK